MTKGKETGKNSAGGMLALLKELLGIGCIGFGGGSALIPVFQDRLAGKQLSQEELDDSVAIACITPGALPVELAAGVGYFAYGKRGMILGAAAVALPGVLLMLLLMVLLSGADVAVLREVCFLAVGVSGYIISMLMRYIKNAISVARDKKAKIISVAIVALAFLVTCEKSLYKLLGLSDMTAVFAIGTVNTMALAFFLAVWVRDKRTPERVIPALALTLMYGLCVGGFDAQAPSWLAPALVVIMAAMAIASVHGDSKEHNVKVHLGDPRPMLKGVACCIAGIAVFSLPAMLLCGDTVNYILNGALSTLLSFGGGDAYIAMADGMFVESGMLDDETFYSLLVPITNALPGSILCKVLAGTGYCIGIDADLPASVANMYVLSGLLLGIAGYACAVGMSCITFIVVHYFYESLDGLKSFHAIKRIIGCVVSGLLLTVALGLLNACAGNAPEVAGGQAIVVALCLVLTAVNYCLKSRFNLHPLAAVVGSAAISCGICNLLLVLA